MYDYISSLRKEGYSWEEIIDETAEAISNAMNEEEKEEETCGDCCPCEAIEELPWDDLFSQILLPWMAANVDNSFTLSPAEIEYASSSMREMLDKTYSIISAIRKIQESKNTATDNFSAFLTGLFDAINSRN